MHRLDRVMVVVLAATLLFVFPAAASQPAGRPGLYSSLSPYWEQPTIRRWEDVITESAYEGGYDPDFLAAVIWKESLGLQYAYGPAGAVGLMQVMPRERGFLDRPTAAQLEEPWRNLYWGTQILSRAIRSSGGDLYNALAAYNGGWDQTHLRGPRRYAGEVLGHYARAVAVRCGLPPEGYWVVTVAPVGEGARGVLTVFGPQRPLTRYSNRPVAASIPDVSTYGPPTAVAFAPPDGRDLGSRIGIWIMAGEQVVHEPAPRHVPVYQAAYFFP